MEETKSDAISAEEAKNTSILVEEDIAKLQLAKKQALAQIAILDMRIAEAELTLKDLARRAAGVAMPEPPAKPEAPKAEEAKKPEAK